MPTAAIAKFEKLYVRPKQGPTMIVGSYVTDAKIDRRTLYKDVVGVDMRPGPGVDRVVNLEHADNIGMFDHVECMSVLEHCERPWKMSRNIERMMNPGATIYVTVPFNWRHHQYPDDYFRISAAGLRSLFSGIEWTMLLYATYQGLTEKPKLPWTMLDGHRFYARSMTCGFGVRK
jgi:hypothetical protein